MKPEVTFFTFISQSELSRGQGSHLPISMVLAILLGSGIEPAWIREHAYILLSNKWFSSELGNLNCHWMHMHRIKKKLKIKETYTIQADRILFASEFQHIPFSKLPRLLLLMVLEWNEVESWFWAGGANRGESPRRGGKKAAPVRECISALRHHSVCQE